MHAGVIRAAFVLDVEDNAPDLSTVAILGSGINGQLPNLDLVNTAVLAFKREHVPTRMDACDASDKPCDDVLNSLKKKTIKLALQNFPEAKKYFNDLFDLFRFSKSGFLFSWLT